MDIMSLLAPAVTIPVIAVLVLAILGQAWDAKRRLKRRLMVQAKLLGKLNGTMIAAVIAAAESEMKKRVAKTVNVTVDETLKAIGMTDAEFEMLAAKYDFKRRGDDADPFRIFSPDELIDALGDSHRKDYAADIIHKNAVRETGLVQSDEPQVRKAAQMHKAAQMDDRHTGGDYPSPRAG